MRTYWANCLLFAVLSIGRPSFADTTLTAQASVASNAARKLHREGDAFYEAQKYAEAHAAYVAAWSLKRHYQIAGNLGDCEMRLGKFRDAAEHLTYFIAGHPKDQPVEEVDRASVMLEAAKLHIGTLTVEVDEPGVDIVVDGKLVGQSPLTSPVFVDPGSRLIEARRDREADWRSVEVAAGSTLTVNLVVKSRSASAPQPSAPPGVNWQAIAVGGAATLSLAAGIGLLAKAASVDAEAAAYRREHGLTDPTSCSAAPTLSTACRELQDIAAPQNWYAGSGIAALALSAGGGAAATYLFLRPRSGSSAKTIGLRVVPGPFFQVQGTF